MVSTIVAPKAWQINRRYRAGKFRLRMCDKASTDNRAFPQFHKGYPYIRASDSDISISGIYLYLYPWFPLSTWTCSRIVVTYRVADLYSCSRQHTGAPCDRIAM
eukprot:jgi/Chrzof1/10326/Cz04g37170.t1